MSAKPIYKFVSKHRGLRLQRLDADEVILPGGRVATRKAPLVYEFQDGDLYASPGEDIYPDGPFGEDGNPTLQDKLSWLRNHDDFGSRFHELTPVAPDPTDLYLKLAEAAAVGDMAAIRGLWEQEAEEWNRPDVLQRIEQVAEQIVARLEPAEKG